MAAPDVAVTLLLEVTLMVSPSIPLLVIPLAELRLTPLSVSVFVLRFHVTVPDVMPAPGVELLNVMDEEAALSGAPPMMIDGSMVVVCCCVPLSTKPFRLVSKVWPSVVTLIGVVPPAMLSHDLNLSIPYLPLPPLALSHVQAV